MRACGRVAWPDQFGRVARPVMPALRACRLIQYRPSIKKARQWPAASCGAAIVGSVATRFYMHGFDFFGWCRRAGRACVPLVLGAALVASAWADDYGDVQHLQSEGKAAAALAKADSYIAAHPNDPQMRFVKANLLSSTGHTEEARKILVQLTHDYPELAEPWNNLAVLDAGAGHLADARQALEMALGIQPDYPTELENMGDLQAREALQSYIRAQQLDPGNARLAPKIAALRRVISAGSAPPAK
jgi:predicted Zn-dependent protease